jgi:hypothetical protein
MEVDLDQRHTPTSVIIMGERTLRGLYQLGSLASLHLVDPFDSQDGNHTLTRSLIRPVESKPMKRVDERRCSHYCGFPQSKGKRIMGNELHANQERALKKNISCER